MRAAQGLALAAVALLTCYAVGGAAQPPEESFCHDHDDSDCFECTAQSYTDAAGNAYGCMWCEPPFGATSSTQHCDPDWATGKKCRGDTRECTVSYWWAYLLLGLVLALLFVIAVWCLDRTLMSHAGCAEFEPAEWTSKAFKSPPRSGDARTRDSDGWCCGVDWLSPRRRFDFGSVAVSSSRNGAGTRSRYASAAEERVELDAEDAGPADGEVEWAAPALGVELTYPPLVWTLFGGLVVYCVALIAAAAARHTFSLACGVLFPALVAPFCWIRRRWRLNLYKSQRSARRRARDVELSRSGLGSDQRFEYEVTWACCISCTRERGPLHDIERVVVFQTHGPVLAPPRAQVSSTLALAAAEAKRAHEPPSPASGAGTGGPVKIELVAVAPAVSAAADLSADVKLMPQPLPIATPPPDAVALPVGADTRDGSWAPVPTQQQPDLGRYFSVYIVLKSMTVELPLVIRAPEQVTRPVFRRLMRLLAMQQSLLSAGAGDAAAEPSLQRRVRPASDRPGATLGGGAEDIAGAVLAYRDGDDDVTADESDAPDAAGRAAVDAAAAAADAEAAAALRASVEAEREAAAALSAAAAGVSGARVASHAAAGSDDRDTGTEHKS